MELFGTLRRAVIAATVALPCLTLSTPALAMQPDDVDVHGLQDGIALLDDRLGESLDANDVVHSDAATKGTDAQSPNALDAESMDDVTHLVDGELDSQVLKGTVDHEYTFTLTKPDIVSIAAFSSGTTANPNGYMGVFGIYDDQYRLVDSYYLYEDESKNEESNWVLPAGTYYIRYTQIGAIDNNNVEQERTVEFVYVTFSPGTGIDLSNGNVFTPNNLTVEQAPVITDTDKTTIGMFYNGYNHTSASVPSSEKYSDVHYYKFNISSESNVSVVMETKGNASMGLLDENGVAKVSAKTDAEGVARLDAGKLTPGTYAMYVSCSDASAWLEPFTFDFSIQPVPPTPGENVYRLFNEWSGEHLFTKSEVERDNLVGHGWKYENVAWVAPKTSATPVYRLYNPWSDEHLYTVSSTEKDSLLGNGWKDEGIAWYSDDAQGVTVYRLFNQWNPEISSHLYTTSESEYNELHERGWRQEGTAWYGMK